VRIAAQRVQAARAGGTISRSCWCRASASARRGRGQHGIRHGAKQALPDLKTASAGVEVSWEIDSPAPARRRARGSRGRGAAEDGERAFGCW
jgi:hypothetical protein